MVFCFCFFVFLFFCLIHTGKPEFAADSQRALLHAGFALDLQTNLDDFKGIGEHHLRSASASTCQHLQREIDFAFLCSLDLMCYNDLK